MAGPDDAYGAERDGDNYDRKRRRRDRGDSGSRSFRPRYDEGNSGNDHGPPQRRRFEEAPFPRLRRQLVNIAGFTKTPQEEAPEIVDILHKNFDDDRLRKDFFELVEQLVLEQPFRIPFVALVAFYGNNVNPEIPTEAIKHIASRTQAALNAGDWTEFKLLLRFLACLQALFEGDGVFALLEQLFDTVVDLQSANENDVVGIELVKIILLTIPYAIAYGGGRFHEHAQKLLDKTAIVAANTLPMEDLIRTYIVDSDIENGPLSHHNVIQLLQAQLEREAASGWAFSCIPRFPPRAIEDPTDENPMVLEPKSHAFPAFEIPSPVNPGPRDLFPEAFFSLYLGQEIETVPRVTDIAACLIRDCIVDTIDQADFNRDIVAKFLIDLDNYWAYDKFAKRGTSFDAFKELASEKEVWKSEDVIVEAIFSQLFKLPKPEHKLVYYHSLITQCCKVAPAAIAPSLGRAIRTIYKNVDIIDLELSYRFLDWFSHHLSNFDFRWGWGEWTDNVSLSDLDPKKAFMIAALDKEIRLSFAKRIRATVPEVMHQLIPERLEEDNTPDFKYDDAATPYSAEAQVLVTKLRKKGSNEDIDNALKDIQDKAAQDGVEDVLVPAADAFMTAICRAGAKSLSHVLSCIERGKEQLLSMARTSDAARRQIVASVVDYWRDQPGVAVRIIDILLNYTVLAPLTVVQWALGDNLGQGQALSKAWVFEMVSNTVAKVTSRNRQIALARLQKGLPQEQVAMVEATLAKDRNSARELFMYIEKAIQGVQEKDFGNPIEESADFVSLSVEEPQLIHAWATRWQTVFRRKAHVEESVVGEQAMEAKVKLLAAGPEPELMDQDNDAKEAANGGDEEML